MKKLSFLLLSAAFAVMPSCSSDEPAPQIIEEGPLSYTLTDSESRAAQSLQDFGTEYFLQSCKLLGGNVVMSPFTMSLSLSMFANAAAPEYVGEYYTTLGYSDLASLNSFNQKLVSTMGRLDPEGAAVHLGSSFWHRKQLDVASDFGSTLADMYDVDFYARDFDAAREVSSEMLSWANSKTDNAFKILTVTPAQVDYYLLNVLNFKGIWTDGFGEPYPTKYPFYGKDFTTKVPMMSCTFHADVRKCDDYSAVRKTFGDGTFTATFVLPAEGKTLEDIYTSEIFSDFMTGEYVSEKIYFELPPFKAETKGSWSGSLTDALPVMGLSREAMKGLRLFEGDKTSAAGSLEMEMSVAFDEKGAEAVVNTGEIIYTALFTEPDDKFYFNRPFLFFITEKTSSLALFAGKIENMGL